MRSSRVPIVAMAMAVAFAGCSPADEGDDERATAFASELEDLPGVVAVAEALQEVDQGVHATRVVADVSPDIDTTQLADVVDHLQAHAEDAEGSRKLYTWTVRVEEPEPDLLQGGGVGRPADARELSGRFLRIRELLPQAKVAITHDHVRVVVGDVTGIQGAAQALVPLSLAGTLVSVGTSLEESADADYFRSRHGFPASELSAWARAQALRPARGPVRVIHLDLTSVDLEVHVEVDGLAPSATPSWQVDGARVWPVVRPYVELCHGMASDTRLQVLAGGTAFIDLNCTTGAGTAEGEAAWNAAAAEVVRGG